TLIDPPHMLFQVSDDRGIVTGHSVANRVWDVERGGSSFDCFLNYLGKEIELGSSSILGRELNVLASLACSFDSFYCPLGNLFRRHAKLELAVNRARGEEDVDPWPGCILDGIGSAIDVGGVATGESTNDGSGHLPCNRLHGLEIPW